MKPDSMSQPEPETETETVETAPVDLVANALAAMDALDPAPEELDTS